MILNDLWNSPLNSLFWSHIFDRIKTREMTFSVFFLICSFWYSPCILFLCHAILIYPVPILPDVDNKDKEMQVCPALRCSNVLEGEFLVTPCFKFCCVLKILLDFQVQPIAALSGFQRESWQNISWYSQSWDGEIRIHSRLKNSSQGILDNAPL